MSPVRVRPSAFSHRAKFRLRGFGLGRARVQRAYIRAEDFLARPTDRLRGGHAVGGVELLEGVGVGAQALLGGVAGLARYLDDRNALVDQQRHERVAQVVGARLREARGLCGGLVVAPAPVVVVVLGPGLAIGAREDELGVLAGSSGAKPDAEILCERRYQPDGAGGVGLGAFSRPNDTDRSTRSVRSRTFCHCSPSASPGRRPA